MILGLIFVNFMYAKEGILSPFMSPSLRLTLMKDMSIRFIDPKLYNGSKSDSLITFDTKRYRLFIGGDKMICKVDENSPVVSTCVDKVRFIDWKVLGEDGQWKFMTDNNLCLTAGSYDAKTRGYFVTANKCNQDIPNQKFKFTPKAKNDDSDESNDSENKKKDTQKMKSNTDPHLIVDSSTENKSDERSKSKKEEDKKNISDFQRDIAKKDTEMPVLITLIDNEQPNKRNYYKTNSNEMKRFLNGNNSKFMDHDFIVDSGINANFIKA